MRIASSLVAVFLSVTPFVTSAIVSVTASTRSVSWARKQLISRFQHRVLALKARYRRRDRPSYKSSLLRSIPLFGHADQGHDASENENDLVQQHRINLRGGGSEDSSILIVAEEAVPLIESPRQRRRAIVVWTVLSTALLMVAYRERALWTPFMNKDAIQARTLSLLGSLQPAEGSGTSGMLRALALYALGMAAWEMAGLSTIPVETAAGMVFGFAQGATASFCGKLLGATLAFVAGRTILAGRISTHKAFRENVVFQLLNNNDKTVEGEDPPVRHPPLLTAFFMKFSCFPELVKNLGSSLIPVIQPWMFVVVTTLHGGFFTLVWTWLGVDSAARMRQASLAVDRPLQATLVLAMIVGCVLTPISMAWWIRDLKRGAAQAEQSKRERRAHFDAVLSTSPIVERQRRGTAHDSAHEKPAW